MVELLCTITGIIAGVAIVASLMQAHNDKARWQTGDAIADESEHPNKMRGIADQLRILTYRVAADVSAHSEKVEAINDRLHEPASENSDEILSAIHELIAANQNMQSQLADARKRIADQTEMIEEATQLARTDALTGLPNRRALNEFLQNCLDAIKPGEFAGLLLLDIDHFKSFNDTYGHTTGDAVLSAFARNIKKFCNQESYPARYGGEEFAVILTGRDAAGLAKKAAALRKFVSEQVIGFEDLQLRITASAGLCLLAPADTLQSAYDLSDEGLYRSKKAGRDQGFWLDKNHWQPFPSVEVPSSPSRGIAPDAKALIQKATLAAESAVEETAAAVTPAQAAIQAEERLAQVIQSDPTIESNVHESLPKSLGDVLDLATFMNRTNVYCEQLRRAELPATGMLIEALWENEMTPEQCKECWTIVQGLIQSQLRGIDVVCVYRANTAGIFLPGCSGEAAIERAARIQTSLEDCRQEWQPAECCPDRLSIAIGHALDREEVGLFLQRLESTLDEAQDASRFEIVFHDGKSTRFQSTVQA